MVRKIVAVAVMVGALAVTACNTVEGAGKDVSSAGSAVSRAADDSK
jgi:predicted small secreted protein